MYTSTIPPLTAYGAKKAADACYDSLCNLTFVWDRTLDELKNLLSLTEGSTDKEAVELGRALEELIKWLQETEGSMHSLYKSRISPLRKQ